MGWVCAEGQGGMNGCEWRVCVQEEVPVVYERYEDLEADYLSGRIHPGDLKPAVTEAINRILEPVREHFASGEPKALLDKIKKFKITK